MRIIMDPTWEIRAYLKLASMADGLSLQKAISPKEAMDEISMKMKKLNMSPVTIIPSMPVVSRR
jgi:hypothetical protein